MQDNNESVSLILPRIWCGKFTIDTAFVTQIWVQIVLAAANAVAF